MTGPITIVCAGRIYCDLVFTGLDTMPRLGTEVFARGLALHAGGGAFITAATLVTLGRPAALWGTIPAEPFAALVGDSISAAGIDASLCAPAPPSAEPQLTVAMNLGDDRAFLTRAPGAAVPEPPSLPRALHLHVGELRTLREHPALIDIARSAGMTVSLDCGWDEDIRPEVVAHLVSQVDVFLPNDSEESRLAELGLPERPAPLTVVKRGERGAVALTSRGRVEVPAPAAEVVDATGAGDAFNAGFLDRWLDGAPLVDCLAAGNACGAATVRAIGGTGGAGAIRGLRSSAALDTG